ncbi:MAG: hypothetical protein HY063_09470 [Bacteroidetes bacterium]|nr:hypothetical protein [Bacteroidota bacterium]
MFEYLQTRTPHFLSQYLKPIPFFTDTVNEGKYYGFDVCVGNYFLQFKKSNLFDIGDPHPKFFNAYNSNYYKLKINTDAKQFKKLRDISSFNRNFNRVFYSSPEFHTRQDMHLNYQGSSIIDNSAHFSVNDFPATISGIHYLIYTDTSVDGHLFSEVPTKIPKSEFFFNTEMNLDYRISLFDMAEKIYSVLNDESNSLKEIKNRESPEKFVRSVWSFLLNEYKIQWYPIISPRLFFEKIKTT